MVAYKVYEAGVVA